METNERKNRTIFIIITIILILLIAVISFLIFKTYTSYSYEDDLYNQQYSKYNELKTKDEEVNKTNEEISNELNYIKNIDEYISNTKKEVFTLASQLEQKIKAEETDVKIAYLTFDDGPYYSTYKYLDVLNKYNVKATFFTIGDGKTKCYDNKSEDCTKLYKAIVDNGHTIANHTYSHAIFYGLYNSADSFMKQIEKQEQLIKEKTGVTTNIARFPGGMGTAEYLASKAGSSKAKIENKLREANYGWVDWTASDGDGGDLRSKSDAWKNFTKSINEDIEVVLFHDYSYITLSILPDAIEYLQDNNYIILPLFYESVMINK